MALTEDGPDFNSAWHPAMRPNSLQDEYPDVNNQKLAQDAPTSSHHIGDSIDSKDNTETIEEINGHPPSHHDADSDDDFFQRYGTSDSIGGLSSVQAKSSHTHDTALSEQESLANGIESLHLTQSTTPPQDPTSEVDAILADTVDAPEISARELPENDDALDEDVGPAENYEYQSKPALLEEAIDESTAAPLLADTDVPTPSYEPATATEIAIQAEPEAALSPSETHGTAESSAILVPEKSSSTDIDWGTTDDFGLGSEHEATGSTVPWSEENESPFDPTGNQDSDGAVDQMNSIPQFGRDEVAIEGQNKDNREPEKGEDLDAIWKAALGDDDFLGDSEDVEGTSFFPDDGEGFLDDAVAGEFPSQQANYHENVTQASQTSTHRYAPTGAGQTGALQNQDQRQTQGQANVHGLQTRSFNATATIAKQQPCRPSPPASSQSFVDKSKGGYSSPYDLPMDVSRPKKRASAYPLAPGPTSDSVQRPMAPPRSSSMQATSPTGQPTSIPPQSIASLSPPPSRHSNEPPPPKHPPAGASAQQPSQASKTSNSDFFADLPVAPRPRGTGQGGRFTPNPSSFTPPPSEQYSVEKGFSPPKPQGQNVGPNAQFSSQLQAPPKLDLFPGSGPLAEHPGQAPVPPANNRYSPATQTRSLSSAQYAAPPMSTAATSYAPNPASQPSPAPSQNRYASAPKGAPPSSYTKPYAPRTSSPLASHQTSPQSATTNARSSSNPPGSLPTESAIETQPRQHSITMSVSSDDFASNPPPPSSTSRIALGQRAGSLQQNPNDSVPVTGLGLSTHAFPAKAQNSYLPQNSSQDGPGSSDLSSPEWSRQPPGLSMKGPKVDPISVHKAAFAHRPGSPTESQNQVINANLGRRRGASIDLGYVAPPDETSQDPLKRWQGYPVFHWGIAGQIVTSFPKQIPRYGPGHGIPMMKSGPGEICVQSSKTLLPLPEDISKFPGPLKSKGKKKEIISWLSHKIDALQQENKSSISGMTKGSDAQTRLEEKVLLWGMTRVLVEHDGVLEGNAAVEETVRNLLTPKRGDSLGVDASLSAGADLSGIAPLSATKSTSEPINPNTIEDLRQFLMRGEREKAVWHAVDKRLWAHALLISSTLGPDLWKQVTREFIRHEVRNAGSNTDSLAALYEVFARNWEESIDELVPAATRAGFQMVSKSDGSGSARNAYEGLDRWRESLCLILSNRTPDDGQAIMALGKLLASYGRIEAAHTCFLFARNLAYIGGSDDPLSNICLLGADHVHRGQDFAQDTDAILLTEVYEFALSLAGQSAAIPHLQPFKFRHASLLAENGHRNEAQQYCDAILTAMKSTTRPSAYYHGGLISQLDDLSKRVSQSPKDASSSWISKPSMDKMSGTMWSKFQNFVSGDDSDAASTRSGGGGEAEVGPFSKIAGDTPVVSRSASSTDLYGSYGSAPALQPVGGANSRYAPANHYAPGGKAVPDQGSFQRQNSTGLQYSRPSLESSRSFDPLMPASHTTSPEMMRPNAGGNEPRPRSTPYVPQTAYSPQPMAPNDSQSLSPPASSAMNIQYAPWGSSQPTLSSSPGTNDGAQFSQSLPSLGGSLNSAYQPSIQEPYDPSSNSYEPPTAPYEPSSYQPYEPSTTYQNEDMDTTQAEQPLPKKKSFMDDDNDDELMRRAASLKPSQPTQSSREPDDAVRKAAEADAARDAEAKAKKGWFTGWFNKKDQNTPPGPVRAKLGDENSFVYDPELKRWVDKKGGAPPPTSTATPPPPKGPSRSASAAGPPLPPSRAVSSSSSVGPPMAARPPSSVPLPGSVPPSRTASPAIGPLASGLQREVTPEEPSSVAAAAAAGPTSHPGPSGGVAPPPLPGSTPPPSWPTTSMSNASSIEDLIGAPQARKGGTIKGKKKGGRYVDVMAR
ncbi:MAG: hypothetical protein Q9165_005137 [Trypethelium subeluteriae]